MVDFAPSIAQYWQRAFVRPDEPAPPTTVNPALGPERRVMILHHADGTTHMVLSPEMADAIGAAPAMSVTELRRRLDGAGIALHDPDLLFYLPRTTAPISVMAMDVRPLANTDRAAFDAFQAAASPQDLDEAYVELDHWAAFGSFVSGRLVSAASLYPWDGAMIADLGVLTLPAFRGRGHARAVVQAISRLGRDRGYEPQYRCQSDNSASIALARAAGFALFGTWEVAVEPAGAHPAA